MKFLTKIAPVALLSILLFPTASHSMMGRALGGLAGGGLVVAGAYGVERYGDRLGSVFARGTQTAQEQIVNQTSRNIEELTNKVADATGKSSNLAETLLRQADRTLAVAERIVDSKLFPYVVVGGAGYFVYRKIQKILSGNNAIKQDTEVIDKKADAIKQDTQAIDEKTNVILQKLNELKAWIFGDGTKTRAQIAKSEEKIVGVITKLEEEILSGMGILVQEITKLDIETQKQLKLILHNLDRLNLSQEEFKAMLLSKDEDLRKIITNLEIANKEMFKQIRSETAELNKKMDALSKQNSAMAGDISEIKQNLSEFMVYMCMKTPTIAQNTQPTFADNLKLYWQSKSNPVNLAGTDIK
ncbi:MAG: hypothetical protein ACOYT8_03985 [Candidatus Dependentiae bacterium]